jgi:hypothetical protein
MDLKQKFALFELRKFYIIKALLLSIKHAVLSTALVRAVKISGYLYIAQQLNIYYSTNIHVYFSTYILMEYQSEMLKLDKMYKITFFCP